MSVHNGQVMQNKALDRKAGFFRSIVLLALVTVVTKPVYGGFPVEFNVDGQAWLATDVVLVAATAKGGLFDVLEPWKGRLQPEEQIFIPELVPSADALPLSRYRDAAPPVYSWYDIVHQHIPMQMGGSHMVLFLRRELDSAGHPEWKPANSMDSMNASVVWIESGQPFWFNQPISWSPLLEGDLKKRVEYVVKVQQQLGRILDTTHGAQRAQSLRQYVNSDVLMARSNALKELGKSDPAAVPTIEEMLDDSKFNSASPDLVKALATAGGDQVLPDLAKRFQAEVAYWNSIGPTLPQGWWDTDTTLEAPLRIRLLVTTELIRALTKARYVDSLDSAMRLRDLWLSSPQLNDPSGLDRLADECQTLITAIEQK